MFVQVFYRSKSCYQPPVSFLPYIAIALQVARLALCLFFSMSKHSSSLRSGWINLLDIYFFLPFKTLLGLLRSTWRCGFRLSLYMFIQLWKWYLIRPHLVSNQPLMKLDWNRCKMQFQISRVHITYYNSVLQVICDSVGWCIATKGVLNICNISTLD